MDARKAKHSNKSANWRTPPGIIGMVRDVLGVIDLDPCTSEEANQLVGARRIFTQEDNSLEQDWGAGSYFINPPGGRNKGSRGTNPQLFWEKLMQQRLENPSFSQAIFLAFNLEMLQTSQNKEFPSLMDFPFCVPMRRIKFLDPETGLEQKSPTHANALVYVPGNVMSINKFEEVFGQIGRVVSP